MSITVSIFIVYFIFLGALAIWSRRETGTLSGFFLAERKLPSWVVAFSTNATGESGWLLLGLTGMGYAVGLQAFWVVVGETIGIALAWSLVAQRLKRLSDQTDSITVPDVLAARFNDTRHILRGLSVVIILLMVGAYVSAQMVATGKAFSSFIDLDYSAAVILGAIVTITYTFVGGFKAVAYTDVVQGVLMLMGLIIVPVVAIFSLGGWSNLEAQLQSIDPALLRFWGPQGGGLPAWIAIISFLAIGIPFLGVPQLMVRFMAARDEREIVKASAISVFVIFLFGTGAVLAGMAGHALFPGLEDPETIFPLLSRELFPPIITGLLMVVVLAAIMSTVDSLLILASSALTRDFLQKIWKLGKSDRVLANYGKVMTLIIGIGGAIFALFESPVIFWFVLFAWSGLGAAFGPVILCALFYRRTTLPGAFAGMLGGFSTNMVWVLAFKGVTYDLYEVIPGFFVGLLLTLIVSRLSHPKGIGF